MIQTDAFHKCALFLLKTRLFVIEAIIIGLIITFSAQSKSRLSAIDTSGHQFPAKLSINSLRSLENRLTPMLEQRMQRSHRSRGIPSQATSVAPSDIDYLLLAREWNNLSPTFRTLYLSAIVFPSTFKSYTSPDGHFEIFYTLQGPDSIDASDRYSYNSTNRKIRLEIKNGIPDYIDEVAWAADSSYSMLIKRMGYIPPIPYKDEVAQSEKYKIIIENQAVDNYGVTVLGEKSTSSTGFSSYISIRNIWKTIEWSDKGYDLHPENGVKVTCVHELFHGIQYAMSHNGEVIPDGFPLSWIEGSAASMEELAFDSINDYHQYANLYFSNSAFPFLNWQYGNTVYINSILLIFLSKITSIKPENDFIKNITFNNYNVPQIKFEENVKAASLASGFAWPSLLHQFHTASYFTGVRADTSKFTSDAPVLKQWNYQNSFVSGYNTQININSNSMEKASISSRPEHNDTLRIKITNTTAQSIPGQSTTEASVIIRNALSDSVHPVTFNSAGNGSLEIPNWLNCNEAIVILTNGNLQKIQPVEIEFEYCPVTYFAGIRDTVNVAGTTSSAQITLKTNTDLRCPIQISPYSNQQLLDYAQDDNLQTYSDLYKITLPESWIKKPKTDSLLLTFSIKTNSLLPNSAASIFNWNATSRSWVKVPSAIDTTDQRITTISSINSGIFTIQTRNEVIADRTTPVCNNVVSISQKNRWPGDFIFTGKTIEEIRVYSLDGVQVCKTSTSNLQSPFELNRTDSYKWNLSKKTVKPGLYTAIIFYRDETNHKKTKLKKLLVAP